MIFDQIVVAVIHLCLLCPILLGLDGCAKSWSVLFLESQKALKKHGPRALIIELNVFSSIVVTSIATTILVLLLQLLSISLISGLILLGDNTAAAIPSLSIEVSANSAPEWYAYVDSLLSEMYRLNDTCSHISECQSVEPNAFNMSVLAIQYSVTEFLNVVTGLLSATPAIIGAMVLLYITHKKKTATPKKQTAKSKAEKLTTNSTVRPKTIKKEQVNG